MLASVGPLVEVVGGCAWGSNKLSVALKKVISSEEEEVLMDAGRKLLRAAGVCQSSCQLPRIRGWTPPDGLWSSRHPIREPAYLSTKAVSQNEPMCSGV